MPSFRTGEVTAVLSERPGLQRVEVDGRPAYVLTQLIGPVAVGERVVVNTTAVDLGLGTGGSDVVHWNLSRDRWSAPGPGHVMKLRYTSLQVDTGAAEERDPVDATSDVGSGEAALSGVLGGRPVVACDLHSQLAPVAAAFADRAPGRRLVYVMTDSASLPLAISELVAGLRAAGLLAATVTAGHAFGGDLEAVNVPSALRVAVVAGGADAIVVGPGPGVVGTGSALGYSGLEVAAVTDATTRLGGSPIVAVRYSGADRRARHRGVSHHTSTALAMAGHPASVPVPDGQPCPQVARHRVVETGVPDVVALLAGAGLDVATMGRTAADDPLFFAYAAAAGVAAAASLSSLQ